MRWTASATGLNCSGGTIDVVCNRWPVAPGGRFLRLRLCSHRTTVMARTRNEMAPMTTPAIPPIDNLTASRSSPRRLDSPGGVESVGPLVVGPPFPIVNTSVVPPLGVAAGPPPLVVVTAAPPNCDTIGASRLEGMLGRSSRQIPVVPVDGRIPTYPFGQQNKGSLEECPVRYIFQLLLAQTGKLLTKVAQLSSGI